AHGTGTSLGDPIEAQALLATYGQDRPADQPLVLGSVKSNIGHTQAAAGVAGVIKMVMALQNGLVPATLHTDEPSPHIDWSTGTLHLATEALAWPGSDTLRRAAVSSFGISGTNAHVILEQAPRAEASKTTASAPPADLPVSWVVTARSAESLREQARRLHAWATADPGLTPLDIAHSLAATRTLMEHRAVVIGRTREELLHRLDAFGRGEPVAGVLEGNSAEQARTVFVFPGQGSQWAGMATGLLDASPVFAERIEQCATVLRLHTDWDLLAVLRGAQDAPSLERVDVVQPVLWALMVSLAEVWRSHGVQPDAVVGHSQGEIAAACVAGVLSLEDGARLVALRSRVIAEELAGHGGMVSIAAPVARVEQMLADRGGVWVATVNGPAATVVAGDPEALDEFIAVCEREGVRARRIPVDYASHTPHVERLREALLELAAPVAPRAAQLPMYSAVTGDLLGDGSADAGYWYRNLRETVRFEQATRTLAEAGHSVFVEVSPHPVLAAAIQETLEDHTADAVVTGTLRRDEGGRERLLTALAELFVTGTAVDWSTAFEAGNPVDLPTYAFTRRRYWLESPEPDHENEAGNPDDELFWAAVDGDDPEGLASTLGVEDTDVRSSLTTVLPALSAWHRRRRDRAVIDSWRYGIEWAPVADTQTARLSGTWLLVIPKELADDPRVGVIAAAIVRRGASALPVVPPSDDPDDLVEHLTRTLGEHPDVVGALSLAAWDEHTHPSSPVVPRALARSLTVIQALAVTGIAARTWCVTSGAVTTGTADAPVVPSQATVWGLGRVAAMEHPDRWGGLVDLPQDLDEQAADRLSALLSRESGEDQLAVRATGTSARRLVRTPNTAAPDAEWTPHGTVLITGGTGAIGRHVARWLALRGAEHLMLLSRRGPQAEGAEELRAELEAAGTRTTILACDAGDRDALAAALSTIPAELPLTAVFHTAAVLDDAPLEALTVTRADAVLRAKTGAAWNLHELTEHLDLSAFVLFSSTAGTFGAAGQGNYAPGNAYLDALAWYRRAHGRVATSIAWGAWADGGMAEQEAVADLRRRHGVPVMTPERATQALAQALDGDDTFVVVADIEWDRFYVAYSAARPSPMLHDLEEVRRLRETATGRPGPEEAGPKLAERLAGLGRPEQERILREVVRAHAAAVLGYEGPDAVPLGRPFTELGLDSVTAVELRNRLSGATERKLPAGLVFDHPTVTALVSYLRGELSPDETEVNPVISDLNRLDVALAGMPDDDPARTEVAEYLEKLLRRVSPEPITISQSTSQWNLDAASQDEVFALIDEELGEP
ncbi:SDR family NAD(P)-dependent oxidoreductase, partial [Streptomyces sp. NPDC052101]|uniref:SDR family NAD(P)-dependent oxidoreductase n=1 Tax=Streptomyces sp. NPDC052101 TaxID=3155763 RepID=UPI0034389314